jgi:head-tail adaptor
MLSETELAMMRATQEEALQDTCTIQGDTEVSDGLGGFTKTSVTVATTVCRVGPTGRSPEERVIADRVSPVQTYTITLPALTSVLEKHRVVTGGRTFEVVGVVRHTYETARRCVCVEVL